MRLRRQDRTSDWTRRSLSPSCTTSRLRPPQVRECIILDFQTGLSPSGLCWLRFTWLAHLPNFFVHVSKSASAHRLYASLLPSMRLCVVQSLHYWASGLESLTGNEYHLNSPPTTISRDLVPHVAMGWQITDAQAAGALCMRDLLLLRCASGVLRHDHQSRLYW